MAGEGEGLAVARVLIAFPGTVVMRRGFDGSLDGWSSLAGTRACATCGLTTTLANPDGVPDHPSHHAGGQ